MSELPIIQRTYDLICWYMPILSRLPRHQRFLLGDRVATGLYDLLENLIKARYENDKLPRLESLNSTLDILRHQTRLLLDFKMMSTERYEYVGQFLNTIGNELGGWIRQQKNQSIRKPVKSMPSS